MRRSRASLAAILTTVALMALAAAPASAGGPQTAEGRARAEHERIVRYWTPARIAAAKPRDFVRTGGGTFQAAPSRGKPGGGGTGNVTGASWTKNGLIKTASGKVLFTMGASQYVCSASVVSDGNANNSRSLVLTAAHCAYDEVADAFATNWMFMPDFDSQPTFDCAANRFGCWTAFALVVHDGYASEDGFTDAATLHDFAIAVVGAGTRGTQLDATVGSFGIGYSGVSTGNKLYAFGYPAAGKYKGKDLVYCAGPIFTDPNNGDDTWGMNCDMTGGSSGGPWLASFNESTGVGTLGSLNSYGYGGLKHMYGPVFNSDTQDVVSAARTATSNTIVQ